MKLLFCFVFVSIAVASVTSTPDNREELTKKTAECRKNMSSIQDLSPQEVKCLGACYLEKLGLLHNEPYEGTLVHKISGQPRVRLGLTMYIYGAIKYLHTIRGAYNMDKANKLVPNKLDMIMDPSTKNKDGKLFKDVSKDIAGKCKTVTDKDKCEAALKIVTCVHDETMKLGFNADVLY